MSDEPNKNVAPEPRRPRGCLSRSLWVVAGIIALYFAFTGFDYVKRQWRYWKHELRVQREFEPVFEKMDEAIAEGKRTKSYDIDKTVRIIHGIDLALKNKRNFKQYLDEIAMQDYRGVAPEVLEQRKTLLKILMRLYTKQVELENQESLWMITSEFLLSTISLANFELGADMTGGAKIKFDPAAARQILDDLRIRKEKQDMIMAEIQNIEYELFDAMSNYSAAYHRYLNEWDGVCLERDHAYLSAHQHDWASVIRAADQAIRKAPHEREAHLLKAMAMLESGQFSYETGDLEFLLKQYLENHPESSAPALLLLGNYYRGKGDNKTALNYYNQATAYFPRQSKELLDMLNPYRVRSYLKKTREGNYILEMYKNTMQGAGYFSPDLQTAKMYFSQGKRESAKRKVLDHFSRRRNQKSWDFVISDIQFCYELMGRDFEKIFPRDHYLDLIPDASFWSSRRLGVAINNRSDTTLRNCTLILCLNLTDMYPGAYEAFIVGETLPVLPAGKTTDFGTVTVDLDVDGEQKRIDDIVASRAILISNDAVIWVDTDDYKITEIIDAMKRRQRGEAVAGEKLSKDLEQALIDTEAKVEYNMGKDDLLVLLPEKIAILKAAYKLKVGDETFEPAKDFIDNGRISLRFSDVYSFGGKAPDMQLLLNTRDLDLKLPLKPSGKDRFKGQEVKY